MNMVAYTLAVIGLLTSFLGIVLYMRKVKQNRTPKTPVALGLFMILGLVIEGYAVSITTNILGTISTLIPLSLSGILALMLGYFLLNKNTPIGNIQVKVGDSVLPFEVATSVGNTFNSEQLKGKRTLLKFYRGSWCPYCSAELQMFDDMLPDLSRYNVQVIALSNDTVIQADTHAKRDKLAITLLSDPELNVIKQYGVEHQKAAGFESDNIKTIFGIPMAMGPIKFRSMSIPTSLLIDENGIIQWIDQSEDYRLRASKDKIMAAINQCFTSS